MREETGPDLVLIQGDGYMTTKEAAEFTRFSKRWFELKRQEGGGPPWTKKGRSVRYLKSGLIAWMSGDAGVKPTQ